MKRFRIAVFASGSGTNAERIFNHFKNHQSIEVSLLLSNNADAYVLKRAAHSNIPTRIFSKQEFRDGTVLQWLKEAEISYIVLAGFLWLVPKEVIASYADRIVNIHPALLPKYGGKGMYGSRVHEAVKAAGDVETGITIHLVNEKYDDGHILFQISTALDASDTPDQIANKVHQLEYAHYPGVIEKWILGKL